jgi:hypothetical protein
MARPSQNVERPRFVPQLDAGRLHTVENFIRTNRRLFSTGGSVVAEWRSRDGRRFGPYFRLKYRQGNVQWSIYLGPSDELAEKVRRLLHVVQFHRTCRRLSARIRASLRCEKKNLQDYLHACGYYMKGFEFHKSRVAGQALPYK